MQTTELRVGETLWNLAVQPGSLITLSREPITPPVSPRAATREAIEKPIDFLPLSQCLTPDDRIAIVIDPTLPQLGELLAGVLDVLTASGISTPNVTLITPPAPPGEWWLDLPDDLDDVQTEEHNPDKPERLSYLAMTEAGRRIYLNRTLTDADYCVIISGAEFDPAIGPIGGAELLFPTLSDSDTRDELIRDLVPGDPRGGSTREAELQEVVAMLGLPMFVRVIRGEANHIDQIIAGTVRSAEEVHRRWQERWQTSISHPARTVVASMAGTEFTAVARALACASRAVAPGGRIILLGEASIDELPPAGQVLRGSPTPSAALERLLAEKPSGWLAGFAWAGAARSVRLFLHSRLSDECAESLFATALKDVHEVNQLLEADGDVIVLPEADRLWICNDEE